MHAHSTLHAHATSLIKRVCVCLHTGDYVCVLCRLLQALSGIIIATHFCTHVMWHMYMYVYVYVCVLCMCVQVQQTALAYELSHEEYKDLQVKCWDKFYAFCLEYHEVCTSVMYMYVGNVCRYMCNGTSLKRTLLQFLTSQ